MVVGLLPVALFITRLAMMPLSVRVPDPTLGGGLSKLQR